MNRKFALFVMISVCGALLLASTGCAPQANETFQPSSTPVLVDQGIESDLVEDESAEPDLEDGAETDQVGGVGTVPNEGIPDAAGAPDTAGIPDAAGAPDTAGVPDAAGAPDTAGVPDAAVTPGAPEASAAELEADIVPVEISTAKATFLELLQHKDSEGLLQLLISTDSEYYADYLNLSGKDMDTVIRLLEFDVELDSLGFVLVESSTESSTESSSTRALYQAVGKKGEADVALADYLFIERDSESIRYGWSYIRYLPYIEWQANEYVKQIQLGDPEALASVMTVDDLAYSKENAETIIYNYKSTFTDMNSLKVLYNGAYEFLVVGARGILHPFTVVYGDGLIGIEDAFAPLQEQ